MKNYKVCSSSGLFLPIDADKNQIITTSLPVKNFNMQYSEKDIWEIAGQKSWGSLVILLRNSAQKMRYMLASDLLCSLSLCQCSIVNNKMDATFHFKKRYKNFYAYIK